MSSSTVRTAEEDRPETPCRVCQAQLCQWGSTLDCLLLVEANLFWGLRIRSRVLWGLVAVGAVFSLYNIAMSLTLVAKGDQEAPAVTSGDE